MKYKVENNEDGHPETQKSIGWAEQSRGQGLGDPIIENVTETWQFIEPDSRQNEENNQYDFNPEQDEDVTTTLKSGKLGEDFYGLNHPNRFTGKFDHTGNYTGGHGYGYYSGYRHYGKSGPG